MPEDFDEFVGARAQAYSVFKKIETRKRFEKCYSRGAEAPQKKKNHSDLRNRPGFRINLFANHYSTASVEHSRQYFVEENSSKDSDIWDTAVENR